MRHSHRVTDPAGERLLLVAHGSPDVRAAASTEDLCRAVRARWPGGAVTATYLDFTAPRLADALPAASLPDASAPVVVPLLLTDGYHGQLDIPGQVARYGADGVRLAEVLGPAGPADRVAVGRLVAALTRRLRQANGGLPTDAIVLAGAGSKDPRALAGVDLVAAALGVAWGVPCLAGYAAGSGPDTGAVVARLRADGARRVALAGYFLAPGLLYDRAVTGALRSGAVVAAAPLGDAVELVDLVLHRAVNAHASAGMRAEIVASIGK